VIGLLMVSLGHWRRSVALAVVLGTAPSRSGRRRSWSPITPPTRSADSPSASPCSCRSR
jgi:hypothetical protein